MFEQPVGKIEKDRSRLVMLSSGAAVLLVIGLIILVSSYRGRDKQVEMAHAGSPEFDSYSGLVSIAINDKRTGERLGVRYARILCTVRNNGERVLTGLEIRGRIISLSNELIREKVISPVPGKKDQLAPSQSMEIDLNIEPIPDPTELKDMLVDLYGLKLQ